MLQGKVEISADTELRAAFAVQGKVPKLVTTLRSLDVALVDSPALARSTPWALPGPPGDIDPAEIFAAHVKLNKARGLGATLAKGMVSIPGLMRKGLEHDYKRNLY